MSAAGTPWPGDVGDEQPGMSIVCNDEVVEVSRNGSHGYVARRNTEVGRVGERGGQNRQLDLLGYLQFFLNLTELQVPLQGLARGDISESRQKRHEANRLDVREPEPKKAPGVFP